MQPTAPSRGIRWLGLSGWLSDLHERHRRGWVVPAVLLAPSVVMLAVLFIYPTVALMGQAFLRPPTEPGPGLTLGNFAKLFGDPFYFGILMRSLLIGGATALLTLVFGYPLALFLARTRMRHTPLLLVLLVAPLYTSIVVRVYAWFVILGRAGLINNVLTEIGLISQPLPLMLNVGGVLTGLFHVYFAFMVLAVYSVLVNVDPTLEEAALSLGATRWRTLREVTVPLSMPGILAGSLLVFVLAMGAYVVPQFLGGRRVMMVSNLIYTVVIDAFNWPFGAAIATGLLVIALALTYFYSRLLEVGGGPMQ